MKSTSRVCDRTSGSTGSSAYEFKSGWKIRVILSPEAHTTEMTPTDIEKPAGLHRDSKSSEEPATLLTSTNYYPSNENLRYEAS